MERILVVSVHPDDETLGCGGTILKHLDKGDEVHCVFVTSGNEEQKKVLGQVAEKYKFTSFVELDFPELKLADVSLNELIPAIETIVKKIKPNVLYIPNKSDIHSDHRAVYDACLAFTKAFRYPYIDEILLCEVLSETNYAPNFSSEVFIPNVYEDVSDYFTKKMEIMNLYSSEIMQSPDPRSLEILECHMKMRGSYIGVKYAEAFQIFRLKR